MAVMPSKSAKKPSKNGVNIFDIAVRSAHEIEKARVNGPSSRGYFDKVNIAQKHTIVQWFKEHWKLSSITTLVGILSAIAGFAERRRTAKVQRAADALMDHANELLTLQNNASLEKWQWAAVLKERGLDPSLVMRALRVARAIRAEGKQDRWVITFGDQKSARFSDRFHR
jgi:hypothetical protein